MKVVVNRSCGSFDLSEACVKRCIELGMPVVDREVDPAVHPDDLDTSGFSLLDFVRFGQSYIFDYYATACGELRSDARLVQAVEELGIRANTTESILAIVEIPFETIDGWHITDDDGYETIREDHRSWP